MDVAIITPKRSGLAKGKEGMGMSRTADVGFDAAVINKENQPVALIQVKSHPIEKWASVLERHLDSIPDQAPFVLTIDPSSIYLYKVAKDKLGEPILQFDTKQILQHYDAEFSRTRIFESYLLTLVEAWLRDLAYHWKPEKPPGSEELRKAGLLDQLEGGTTQRLGA